MKTFILGLEDVIEAHILTIFSRRRQTNPPASVKRRTAVASFSKLHFMIATSAHSGHLSETLANPTASSNDIFRRNPNAIDSDFRFSSPTRIFASSCDIIRRRELLSGILRLLFHPLLWRNENVPFWDYTFTKILKFSIILRRSIWSSLLFRWIIFFVSKFLCAWI